MVGLLAGSLVGGPRRNPRHPALQRSRRSPRRRANSYGIEAELLQQTLLAWLRGEPRVCSMVPIPSETDEDRRPQDRLLAAASGSGRNSSPSGSASSTALTPCWPRWACTATTLSAETGAEFNSLLGLLLDVVRLFFGFDAVR